MHDLSAMVLLFVNYRHNSALCAHEPPSCRLITLLLLLTSEHLRYPDILSWCVQSFALLSFSYSVPLCILKRLREKEDCAHFNPPFVSILETLHVLLPAIAGTCSESMLPGAGKNHSAAGAISGLVIAWGNSPMNMLGSSLLLAAVSGYLSRAEPGTEGLAGPAQAGAANAAELQPSSRTFSYNSKTCSSQKRYKRRRRAEGPLGPHGASMTATVCPHDLGLLEHAAHYINCPSYDSGIQSNVALATSTVWEAVRPGCRSCYNPRVDHHTDFL